MSIALSFATLGKDNKKMVVDTPGYPKPSAVAAKVSGVSEESCDKICNKINDFKAISLKNKKAELELLRDNNNITYLKAVLGLIGQRENDVNKFIKGLEKIIKESCPPNFCCIKSKTNNEEINYTNLYRNGIEEIDQEVANLINHTNKIAELFHVCETAKKESTDADH